MKINHFKDRHIHTSNAYRATGTVQGALSNILTGLGRSNHIQTKDTFTFQRQKASISAPKLSVSMLDKFNSSDSYTRIGDVITLNDGMTFHVNQIPKLNVEALDILTAKDNFIDFGSASYFRYTNSSGKSMAMFSIPDGAICRPWSEKFYSDGNDYDKEAVRYLHFWNNLASGGAMMSSPKHFGQVGYYNSEICDYLDDAGISKGFFSVKVGSRTSEFFYSASEHDPVYTKQQYDDQYRAMTSPDFSYNKSMFRYLEPGTEITIAGEKFALKEDLTLDIPYGIDIYDIHYKVSFPEDTSSGSKTASGIDCLA